MEKGRRKLIVPYLFPAVFLYLGFLIIPAIYGLYLSFHKWSGGSEKMEFVGLTNYSNLMKDNVYWSTFINMMLIVVVGGIFVFLIGLLFTAIMSEGIKGKRIIRSVIFFPQIVAPIALALVWNFLYRYDVGLFNAILNIFNIQPVEWTGPDMIMGSAIAAIVWYSLGFYAIILLSGVDKIPQTIFESDKIEGASIFRIFFKITLPLIWDVLLIALVLWIINMVRVFDFLYAFGGPIPPQKIWNLALYQFISGFGGRDAMYQLGYSSAISITMIIVITILVLTIRKLLKREVYEL